MEGASTAGRRHGTLLAAGTVALCVGCGGLATLVYGVLGTGAFATGVAYGAPPLVVLGAFLFWASRR
ncbi:MAG: hypothetical protein HY556_04790 [Euryarchaeota archaeon]|nr:hypothetical protein [Euryarchaeota archaeon]